MVKLENESFDILNLQDDYPTISFGPRVQGKGHDDDVEFTPFFISLNIHEMTLHNIMLDSGASHNLLTILSIISLSDKKHQIIPL